MNKLENAHHEDQTRDPTATAALSRRMALRLAVMSAIGTSLGVVAPARSQSEPSLGLYVGDELTQSVVLSSDTIDALSKKGGVERLTIKLTKDRLAGTMKPDPAFKESLAKVLKASR